MRSHSEHIKHFTQTGRLDDLWYPDDQTRALSLAYLQLATSGRIQEEVEVELKQTVKPAPMPFIYLAVAVAHRPGGCLDEATRNWLSSELYRLAEKDFVVANGVNTVLNSMLQIIGLLEADRQACPNRVPLFDFGQLKAQLLHTKKALRKKFMAFGEGRS